MASISEINAFLTQVKASLNANNYQILDKRTKYISTLSQLGILKQDVLDDINALLLMRIGSKNRIITPLILVMYGFARNTCMELAYT